MINCRFIISVASHVLANRKQ